MPIRQLLTLSTLLFISTSSFSQDLEPLDLARNIFSQESITNITDFVTGEYEGRPNGQDLPKSSKTQFILLSQTPGKAVVGMSILDSVGKGLDTYLHFEKSTRWKLSAFRALAMTGILEEVRIELERLSVAQVDSLIQVSQKNKKSSMFTSREDYEFQLGNIKLTLDLDANIINHFLENKAEFERIKDLAFREIVDKKLGVDKSTKLVESSKPQLKKLYISSVSSGGHEFGQCLNFLIGGMIDNSVGYIFVKDKKDLPEMSSQRIIMLREIGDGWYIYKTT